MKRIIRKIRIIHHRRKEVKLADQWPNLITWLMIVFTGLFLFVEPVTALVFNSVNSVFGNVDPLDYHELKKISGHYRLVEMVLEDAEDQAVVRFHPGENMPVIVDDRRQFLFAQKKAGIFLDSKKSILSINERNVCNFKWSFDSLDESFNKEKVSLGRFYISGDSKSFGCFSQDKTANIPTKLMPLENVRFQIRGQHIIFKAVEGGLSQTLYYIRIADEALGLYDIEGLEKVALVNKNKKVITQ